MKKISLRFHEQEHHNIRRLHQESEPLMHAFEQHTVGEGLTKYRY